MSLIGVSSSKPQPKQLAAKIHPEPGVMAMEVPDLPDFYRDQATQNLCIVSVAKAAEKSKGGIFIPDVANEASDYLAQIGRIEAVGPFFYNEKRWGDVEAPQIGDFVMFEPHVGRRFDLNGNKFMIIKDTHILLRKLRPEDDFKLFT